jgi:glycosyltransferase involved in cell wall biosynthesis
MAENARVAVVEVVFWVAVGLLVYAQVGYPVLLGVLGRLKRVRGAVAVRDEAPRVSLIVAAHREAEVIGAKVANARELEWPAGRLEVIVACDGSPDDTAVRARAAGADVVLELPWGGKVRAQDAAVERASGELLAFSDANALWDPGALRALAAPFADAEVGYACGQVRFVGDDGGNQEGLYWRYEMAIRARESQLASVTAGNGAIYAVRPEAYVHVDPVMGHDLSFPFNMVKRGWRAVYAPKARATEKMVPTVEGEFARKRRMMSHAWPIVLRGGLLSPKGYTPLYALMIVSHRVLRYGAPFLHLVALIANAALLGQGWLYAVAFGVQLGVVGAAVVGRAVRLRPLLIARYYVLTTASVAAGLYDYLRHGTPAGWAPPEGTR